MCETFLFTRYFACCEDLGSHSKPAERHRGYLCDLRDDETTSAADAPVL